LFPWREHGIIEVAGNQMHVIHKRPLKEFWQRHRDVQGALEAWLAHVERAEWDGSADVVADYRAADILPGDRVVFNLKGNQYRLVARIRYSSRVVYVRFIGTHQEYDRIDATEV
jgi:mRNA interferase HigB